MATLMEVLQRQKEKVIADSTVNGFKVTIRARRSVNDRFFVTVYTPGHGREPSMEFEHRFLPTEEASYTMRAIMYRIRQAATAVAAQELAELREENGGSYHVS